MLIQRGERSGESGRVTAIMNASPPSNDKTPNAEMRMSKANTSKFEFRLELARLPPMSEELKNRTKNSLSPSWAVCWLPQTIETRHAIGQGIRSSSSLQPHRSACVESRKLTHSKWKCRGEADKSGLLARNVRDIAELRHLKIDARARPS